MDCTPLNAAAAGPGFAPARVERIARPDGGFVLRSPIPLAPCTRCVGDWLVQWAQRTPQRTWLAERSAAGWRAITYAQGLAKVRAIGGALVRRGLGTTRPLVVLSDNSVDHALLAVGAQLVGVPHAPISPAYSLLSSDHTKLRAIVSLLEPGLVYADDGARFAHALNALGGGFEFVASRNVPAGATRFDDQLANLPGSRSRRRKTRARLDRQDGCQPARHCADHLFQCPARLRCAAALARDRRRLGASLLLATEDHFLRRRRTAARRRSGVAAAWRSPPQGALGMRCTTGSSSPPSTA